MSPNKQGRKQRARGKNTTNQTRDRTILTLAEDPASPYLLPTKPSFSPGLSNMFTQFPPQGQQQQQQAASISDVKNLQYQQKPNMHQFNKLQSSNFFDHIQAFHNQSQGVPHQSSGGLVSDLERLRQLKSTILAGQHPFFQPVPNPDALESIYLGPHPASQAFQQQNQPNQPTEAGHGSPLSLPQTQPENSSAKKLDPPPQLESDLSSNNSKALNPDSSLALAAVPSNTNDQSAGTPATVDVPNAIIPQRSDCSSDTPSPLPPKNATSSANDTAQDQQRVPPTTTYHSGASDIQHEHQGHLPSTTTSPVPMNNSVDANKSTEGKDSSAAYHDIRIDPRPGLYDRERPGRLPYESPRSADRHDNGRFTPRFYDSRYGRDRDWDRNRDWDRDRERNKERDREREREREHERERDRDRRPLDDRLPDERRTEYEKLSRLPLDREPTSPQTCGTDEQRPIGSAEPHQVPPTGQSPEQRQLEISTPSEQRHLAAPRPEHSPHQSVSGVTRSVAPTALSLTDRQHTEISGSSFSNQPSHDHDRSRFGPVLAPRTSPPQNRTAVPSQQHHLNLPEQRQASVSTSPDDRSVLHSAPPDQRAPSGNAAPRPSGSSSDNNRHAETVAHLSTGGSIPSLTEVSASRGASERRLTHPGDPPPPPRGTSRPVYSHISVHPPPSTIFPLPSQQVDDVSYETTRDRERDRAAPVSNYRELPSGIAGARGFTEDPRRQPLETSASRHTSDYYTQTLPAPTPPVVDRPNETRHWRERGNYPSYPGSVRRYPDNSDWHRDPYRRDRSVDMDVHQRARPSHRPLTPVPPWYFDRGRPTDKDKERDKYEGWTPERNAGAPPPSSAQVPPPWEDPASQVHRPLQTRLSDSYDDRFIPRDSAERGRYPLPSPSIPDVSMRDNFRENPRVRPRSPSPGRPPAVFEDTHRAKRAREEYEPLTRPPYYDDAHRPGPPAAGEYVTRGGPSPPPYYDLRAPALANPRDPSPYSRDRAPDPYHRRDMPPPRSPPFYGRERYPSR